MKNLTNILKNPVTAQYLQSFSLLTYLTILLFQFQADRVWSQYPFCLGLALALDTILYRLYYKQWRIPVTAVVGGTVCFLLMSSRFALYPYIIAVTLAIGSKYVIRVKDGHVFNPGNFGVLTTLLIFPDVVGFTAAQWIGSYNYLAVIIALGLLVSGIAGKTVVAATYFCSFFIMRATWAYTAGLSPNFILGPVLGYASFLFTFHMITDPKTSPKSKSGQFAFGLAVAGLDFLFRYQKITFAPLLSLAIMCGVYAIERTYNFTDRLPWKQKSLA